MLQNKSNPPTPVRILTITLGSSRWWSSTLDERGEAPAVQWFVGQRKTFWAAVGPSKSNTARASGKLSRTSGQEPYHTEQLKRKGTRPRCLSTKGRFRTCALLTLIGHSMPTRWWLSMVHVSCLQAVDAWHMPRDRLDVGHLVRE